MMILYTNGYWLKTKLMDNHNQKVYHIKSLKIHIFNKKPITIKVFGKVIKNIPYGVMAKIVTREVKHENNKLRYITKTYNNVLIKNWDKN